MSRQIDIEIVDGNIRLDLKMNSGKTNVVSNLSEEKLRQYYQSKVSNLKAEILPPAVRYLSNDKTRLIWERPPGYYTINYSPYAQNRLKASSDSMGRFRIPTPWQVYLVCFNEDYVVNTLYMFFRNEPLGVWDRAVYMVPLNNFYRDSRLCQAVYDHIPEANNLFQMLNNVYDMVWNSGFNEDLHDLMDVACQNGNGLDNNLLSTDPSDRSAFYKKWSAMDLDEIVSSSWPVAYPDILALTDNHIANADNIRTVQFLMDIQSA